MKTTNAKAFQTPGPPLGTIKPARSGKRGSTARKLKQSAPKQETIQETSRNVDAEEEVPDIEYMPPAPQRELRSCSCGNLHADSNDWSDLQRFRTILMTSHMILAFRSSKAAIWSGDGKGCIMTNTILVKTVLVRKSGNGEKSRLRTKRDSTILFESKFKRWNR